MQYILKCYNPYPIGLGYVFTRELPSNPKCGGIGYVTDGRLLSRFCPLADDDIIYVNNAITEIIAPVIRLNFLVAIKTITIENNIDNIKVEYTERVVSALNIPVSTVFTALLKNDIYLIL